MKRISRFSGFKKVPIMNVSKESIKEAKKFIFKLENGAACDWYKPLYINKKESLVIQDYWGRVFWVKKEFLNSGKFWQLTINKPKGIWQSNPVNS